MRYQNSLSGSVVLVYFDFGYLFNNFHTGDYMSEDSMLSIEVLA